MKLFVHKIRRVRCATYKPIGVILSPSIIGIKSILLSTTSSNSLQAIIHLKGCYKFETLKSENPFMNIVGKLNFDFIITAHFRLNKKL